MLSATTNMTFLHSKAPGGSLQRRAPPAARAVDRAGRRPTGRTRGLDSGRRQVGPASSPHCPEVPSRFARIRRAAACVLALAVGLIFAAAGVQAQTDTTAPVFQSATVNGTTLKIIFDEALSASHAPPGSRFGIINIAAGKVHSVGANVPVSIRGTAVTVTLSIAAVEGETYRVAYSAQGAPLLQDADGNEVKSFFRDDPVTNETDTTPPALQRAEVDGTALSVTFNEALDPSALPSGEAFAVTATRGGSTETFAGTDAEVSIDGATVSLTLARPVLHGDTAVTVAYTKPATDPLRDGAGNAVASFTGKTATNGTPVPDATAPAFRSATIDGTTLKITFNEALSESHAPPGSRFGIIDIAAGKVHSVGANAPVSIGGTTVTVTLTIAAVEGETYRVAYSAQGAPLLQDADGNEVKSFFRDDPVTNETDTTPPAFQRAEVDGTALSVTFNEALDPSALPSGEAFAVTATRGGSTETFAGTDAEVSIDGATVSLALARPVLHGDTAVTVAYTKPATDPLRDGAGNAVAGFTGGAATNGTPAPAEPTLPPAPAVASVAITSTPSQDTDGNGATDTYGAGEDIEVTVTWDRDVTWDVSASGADLRLRLDVSGAIRTASLVKGGATAGTARALAFRYRVKASDTDTDGVFPKPNATGDMVLLVNGATLTDAHGRDAARTHAALSADAGHKVNGGLNADPAPAVQSAELVGTTLAVTFSETLAALDTAAEPALRHAFLVIGTIDGGYQQPLRASISGATLTLELGAVLAGDRTVALSYYPTWTADPLRDTAGNRVAQFADRQVTYATGGRPVLEGASVDAVEGGALSTLELTFSETLAEGSPPSGSAFEVVAWQRDGWTRTMQGTGQASISGATVMVTLDGAVHETDRSVTVSYAKPASSPLRDLADNAVASFEQRPVTIADGRAPILLAGGVAGTTAALYFSEPLDTGSTPATGDFTVSAGGSTQTVSGVKVAGNAVTLTLDAATAGDHTVGYTPGTNPLRDAAGNAVATFSNEPLANEGAVDPGAPALETAQADAARVTLAFDQPLDPGSVPAPGAFGLFRVLSDGATKRAGTVYTVAVEGTRVVLGLHGPVHPCDDDLRVSYAKPAEKAKRLHNLFGTAAGGIAEAAAQAVENLRAGDCASWRQFGGGYRVNGVLVEAPGASGGGLSGQGDLVIRMGRTLQSNAELPGRAFLVKATPPGGQPRTIEGTGMARIEGETVAVRLASGVAADETVSVSYRRPRGTAGLMGADGTQLADVAGMPVENALAAPPPGPAPLTAAFVGVPDEHDGKTAFSFGLRFSEDFPGRLSYKVFKDHALQVTNGRAIDVKLAAPGQNQRWTITVRPWSVDDVTVTLPAAGDCAAPASVCTQAGRKLSNTVTARILGPALISVADAEAREGADEAIAFAVTLNRAASGPVTVDYATADGAAVAGEDYTATSGTLTFAAGETAKTVAVPILDDGHDEGKETFLLRLSNAQGAAIADGEATGTIVNADPIPKAWLARFGRTVTGQVLDAVEARLAAPRQAGAQAALAGQALPSWTPGDGPANDNGKPDRAAVAEADRGRTADAMRRWMAFAGADDGSGPGQAFRGATAFGGDSGSLSGTGSRPGLEARAVTQRDLLTGTSFALSAQAGGPGGGFASLWGRGAIASFDGREGDLALDGEVTTGLLGADWVSDPDGSGAGSWTAGLALGHSTGTGGYRRGGCASSQDGAQDEGQPNCGGRIEATLTGVYPYAGAWLSDRHSVWLAAGHGTGEVTVLPDRRAALKADLAMTMGAAGMRSEVLKPADGGGLALAAKGDARFTRTESEAVRGRNGTGNMAAAEADVWLVRTGIEGSRRFALPGSESGKEGAAHVTPSFEAGLRLDGGDAETGFGADLGGGLAFADPGSGLTLDVKARGLLAHEASGFREWGASGSVAWDPRPSTERGLALSLTQSWGASPSGGMDALLSRETLAGLAANEDEGTGSGRFRAAGRLEGEIGYGLPAFGGAFTGTPNLGFGLSDGGARDYRIGWRLTSAVRGDPGFEVSLDATRREPANDNGAGPEHGVMLRASIRW